MQILLSWFFVKIDLITGRRIRYPLVQIMMKDTENEGTYYAIVDYMFEYPEEGKQLEYEYLVELQKNDNYTIKAIKEIKDPIDFEILNQFLYGENE